MDKEIRVSVICPTYNHEKYIKKAIDSVLMQETDFDFEIIVGNDCSTDRTEEILEEYNKKNISCLTILNRKKNMGATRNIYDLYGRAKGKYLVTLETDDYFTDSHKLQIQYDFLENHPQYSGVAHDFQIVDVNGNLVCKSGVKKCKAEKFYNRNINFNDFMEYGFFFHTATKMHINFMDSGQDYSELFFSHPLVGDLTVNSILLNRGPIYLMRETMSAYREVIDADAMNARSIARRNMAGNCMDNARMYKKLTEFFEGKLDFSKFIIKNLNTYLMGMVKREKGFNIQDYWFCLNQCKKKVWFYSWGILLNSWLKQRLKD